MRGEGRASAIVAAENTWVLDEREWRRTPRQKKDKRERRRNSKARNAGERESGEPQGEEGENGGWNTEVGNTREGRREIFQRASEGRDRDSGGGTIV
jgi:hypothetical protein